MHFWRVVLTGWTLQEYMFRCWSTLWFVCWVGCSGDMCCHLERWFWNTQGRCMNQYLQSWGYVASHTLQLISIHHSCLLQSHNLVLSEIRKACKFSCWFFFMLCLSFITSQWVPSFFEGGGIDVLFIWVVCYFHSGPIILPLWNAPMYIFCLRNL